MTCSYNLSACVKGSSSRLCVFNIQLLTQRALLTPLVFHEIKYTMETCLCSPQDSPFTSGGVEAYTWGQQGRTVHWVYILPGLSIQHFLIITKHEYFTCFINTWFTCLVFVMPHLSILNNGKSRCIKNPLHVHIDCDVIQHGFVLRTHGTDFHFAIAEVFIFSRL